MYAGLCHPTYHNHCQQSASACRPNPLARDPDPATRLNTACYTRARDSAARVRRAATSCAGLLVVAAALALGVLITLLKVSPRMYCDCPCPPRHRMPFNSRNEG